MFHDSQAERHIEEEEVVFRENNQRVEDSTPPTTITSNDLDVIIEGWERKFQHLSQCMREIQLASEKANTNMSNIVREGRAREGIQERRIEEMHEDSLSSWRDVTPRTLQHRASCEHAVHAIHTDRSAV